MKKIISVIMGAVDILVGCILLGTTLIITDGFISNDYYGNFFERLYEYGLIPVLIVALFLIIVGYINMSKNAKSDDTDNVDSDK